MKNMTIDEILAEADRKYQAYISHYGLRNAKKIVMQIGRLLRAEGNRRKQLKENENV